MTKFWSQGDADHSSDSEPFDDNHGANLKGSDRDGHKEGEGKGKEDDPNAVWFGIEKTQVFLDPIVSSTRRKPDDCVRMVCISDTHGKHDEVRLPVGGGVEILVHGGDFTKSGEIGTIQSLSRYFENSGIAEVVCIAGNHDLTLHPEFYQKYSDGFHSKPFNCEEAQKALRNCIYLKDSSCTTTHGIEVYGSPWSPEYFNWAFNLPRGLPIRQIWDQIPATTDILITHGPPLGRGDLTTHSGRAGCHDLLRAVQDRIKPRVHIFGHIHEGAGVTFDGHTLYINASNLNSMYRAKVHPVVIDVPLDPSRPAMVVTPECPIRDASALVEWMKSNNFHLVARAMASCTDLDELPYGNTLLQDDAYTIIADKLMVRERRTRGELLLALNELYAQSFSQ